MARLMEIRETLHASYDECSKEMVPFDKVFDEDKLEAHREHIEILKDEIANLELRLIAIVCNPDYDNSLDSTVEMVEYEQTTEMLSKFCIRHQKAENKLRSLLMERKVKHKIWKEAYNHNAEKLTTISCKITRLNEIAMSFAKVRSMHSKPRHNLILMIQLHSQVNFLLSLGNVKRENTPFAAFKKAHSYDLIDQRTYDALMH
jgi:hypothetical protein